MSFLASSKAGVAGSGVAASGVAMTAIESMFGSSHKAPAVASKVIARAADELMAASDGLLGALIPDETDLSDIATTLLRSSKSTREPKAGPDASHRHPDPIPSPRGDTGRSGRAVPVGFKKLSSS